MKLPEELVKLPEGGREQERGREKGRVVLMKWGKNGVKRKNVLVAAF